MRGDPTERRRLQIPLCLRCHGPDQLERVTAVVQDGRSTGEARGRVVGRYGYDLPVRARVVRTTALARALAPPARPRPIWGSAIGLAVAGLLILGIGSMAFTASAGAGSGIGVAVFMLVFASSAAVSVARLRRAQVTGSLVEGAVWLWRRSWYCRRCDIVSVLTPNGSTVVATRGLGASLIELSGRTRWQEAGAGHRIGARPGSERSM
jgi:hypothetical protein